jgi:hypothetical protein
MGYREVCFSAMEYFPKRNALSADSTISDYLAENSCRKDFTPSEMVAIADTLERRERELAKERQREAGRAKASGKFPGAGQVRDRIAAPLGISGRTLVKAKTVVQAAEQEPERFGHLVREMDRSGKVNDARRALTIARDEQRVLNSAPVEGKFKTLVIDPPWQYEIDFLGRGAPAYATMSFEELNDLPVAGWAEARLAERGYVTPSGKYYSASAVQSMLG